MSGSDDVRLTVEIVVASSQVGRIIGKGGQNVRELQRVTGSLIKLPEQPPPAGAQPDHETTVHIVGPFYSVQVRTRLLLATLANLITLRARSRPLSTTGMGNPFAMRVEIENNQT